MTQTEVEIHTWARVRLRNNEKKRQDLSIMTYNKLQIKQFLQLFLNNYGLNLKNLQFFYKKNSLHLYINYDILITKLKYLLLSN